MARYSHASGVLLMTAMMLGIGIGGWAPVASAGCGDFADDNDEPLDPLNQVVNVVSTATSGVGECTGEVPIAGNPAPMCHESRVVIVDGSTYTYNHYAWAEINWIPPLPGQYEVTWGGSYQTYKDGNPIHEVAFFPDETHGPFTYTTLQSSIRDSYFPPNGADMTLGGLEDERTVQVIITVTAEEQVTQQSYPGNACEETVDGVTH